MKKIYLLALALALPIQANAANNDSVYTWGSWSQNIQPAAGPVATVTPSPVAQPKADFRQNENPAFNRIDLVAQASAQAAADSAAQAAADAAAQAANIAAQAAANAAAQAAADAAALAQAANIAAQQAHVISGSVNAELGSSIYD